MIRFLLLLAVTVFSLPLLAQQRLPGNSNIYNTAGLGLVYDHELTFNLAIATPRNFSFGVRSHKLVAYDKARFWTATFGDIRHAREHKENPDRINIFNNRVSRSYVYGKQNQLYALRVGFGRRKYISEKARQKGVAVGYSYEFGPSLGILKPYYIEVDAAEPDNPGQINDIRYTEENAALFLNENRIFGGSAWTLGLDELSFRPGIHAKIASHFGFGAYDETAKSLEAGILADFFLGDTDIMVESPLVPGVSNSPLFLSLYINVQIGKRW